MLGCWCRRETEERQKERRADSRVPTMLSMPPCLSIPLYPDRVVCQPEGCPSQFHPMGNLGSFPRAGMSIPGRSSLHLLNNGRPNEGD